MSYINNGDENNEKFYDDNYKIPILDLYADVVHILKNKRHQKQINLIL